MVFRQATSYLAEPFRHQATLYLAELFRQATFYLAELFRQIAFSKTGCVYFIVILFATILQYMNFY